MSKNNRNKDWPYWAMVAFILAAMSYAYNAKAETNVYVGAWSKHLITKDDTLNEEHRLLAVDYKGWLVGRFDNSYNRESYVAAKKFEWRAKDLRVGFYAGAVRGYTKCYGDDNSNTDTCPLIVPYVTYSASVAPMFMLMGEAAAVAIKIEF